MNMFTCDLQSSRWPFFHFTLLYFTYLTCFLYFPLFHLTAFSNKKRRPTCRNSFSAVSKALMLSNGAFFAEWCTLQRKTKRKHGIDEKSTVSANAKNRAPRAAHKQHSHHLPNTLSSKGANQEALLAVHPALRPPRSAPYRGERTSKLGDRIYHLSRANPPKLGRIRVDFEKLWSRRFSRKVHDPKKSHFCLGSFSLVSTIFSILSSLSGRTRPHLALETQNFRNNSHKKF